MKINKIDRDALKVLRSAINAALESVGKEYGVKLSAANASYDASGMTGHFKVEINTISGDGQVVTKEVSDFKKYHDLYNLKEEHLNAEFTVGREKYRIGGLLMNAKRFPILGIRVKDGRQFKFPESAVASLSGKAPFNPRSAAVSNAFVGTGTDTCANDHAFDFATSTTKKCANLASTSRKFGAKFTRLCASCAQLHDEAEAEMRAEARCS
jgi:hypothetical protein